MEETVKKTKILVYDADQVFLKYFSKVFPSHSFVDFSGNEGDDFILNEYGLIIYIVDTEFNLSRFFKILNNRIPILLGSSPKKIPLKMEELKRWFDIKFINIDSTKMEVRDQLRFHLDQYSKTLVNN